MGTNAKKIKKTYDQPHVIVVGAGLAGLTAAYELEQHGFRCTVLEAEKEHVGGRVRTFRFENKDGSHQYGELGAMRIPSVHKQTLEYIDRFGLKLRPFINSNANGYFHVRNKRLRRSKQKKVASLYELRPNEQDQTADEIWESVVSRLLETLTEEERNDLIHSQRWKTRKLHELDQRSLHSIFEEAGISPAAIEYFAVTGAYGETLLGSGFIEHLREEAEKVWLGDFHEIIGGMDKLPKAFVAELKGNLKKGCEVISFKQNKTLGKVTVHYRKGNKKKKIKGDFAVCAVPFSVMEDMQITPAFSPGKQRAIRQMFYESATKVLLHTSRRFWEEDDHILGGSSYTDLLTGPIFYPSDNAQDASEDVSAGPGAFIASYNWGEAARRLGALPPDRRVELAKQLVSKVHPQLLNEPDLKCSGVSMAWGEYRYSRGAFSFYAPGQFARLHQDCQNPELFIHFAGEHTSTSHTWIEGAIVSGQRVAREILTRFKQT